MKKALVWLQGTSLAALACGLLLTPTSRGGDVGYVEDFALARDRTVPLRQLIPGTEDYYYYHCLHYLNSEQFARVEQLTKPWLERFGQTARLTEIQTRHALLTYERDPKKSLAYLTTRLGLRFDHQKETVGAVPDLPTALDPKLISRDTLKADSFRRWANLDNFEDRALDWVAVEDLNWERRRNLLQRLQRPDVADLPKLIVADLQAPHAPEFGAYPIHFQLTLAQLDELLERKADLLNHAAFVKAYVTRLQPGADDPWKRNRKVTEAYLDRLQKFVARLAPVHNPLKAHVQFHRLAFDRAGGVFDAARFLDYLKLPRFQPYCSRALNEREESRRYPANLDADYSSLTLLPPVGPDEPLVRSYLKHFFTAGEGTKAYEPFIDDVYLTHLFAETAIEDGRGDPETWASKLPPELFRQLKDRIDIDFAFTNKTDYAADELVQLDLFVKNVPSLLVKVFEINTRSLYRARLQEVDTDINLDGLIANSEKVHRYDDPPLRRQARRFEFPELTKPGVYVIDFIGAGKSSRALIRKGRLRPLVSTGPAGQTIHVIDEKNRPVDDAVVWLGNQEYRAGKDGAITVPFTAEPGRRPIVLSQGDFASLDFIEHQPETYRLAAGIHIDRESLLTQKIAAVMVRPGLFLNDTPVSLKLLEDVKLRITSIDSSDIPAAVEAANFKLFEDRESVYEVRVPGRLKALTVTLTAKVKNLGTGKPVELAAAQSFALNDIDRTDRIEDLHFGKFGADYLIELLGRSGEPKADRPVQLALKHRDFKEPVRATLKTDAEGRVKLGPLPEIASVTATGPEGTSHTWTLSTDAHTYRALLHARAGEPIRLPYLGGAEKPGRDEFSLFEVRGSDIRADRFDALALRRGQLELRDLSPGDYDLWLKRTGERIRVRVVAGTTYAGYVLGATRHLELPGLEPLCIRSIATGEKSLTIRLGGVSKYARVHVFGTRYQPAFSAFADLSRVRAAELSGLIPGSAESVYLTGRNIGDEYRYVLDRRGQKKFPGNMLERPSLLLNPWAVRATETGEQLATGGDDFGKGGRFTPPGQTPPGEKPASPGAAPGGSDFANLDFLADASAVLLNLVPDQDGVVELSRKELGTHSMIHIVAVDPLSTTYRSITLPEQTTRFLDLRLKNGLDPAKHFTQQKQVSIVPPGEPLVIPDVVGSRFQMYDSLPKVFAFYSTLTKNPQLTEFAFLLNWPKLKPEEKRALYSQYACHEFHFFLFKKDRPFFDEVVKPYLRHKKDRTFLDHWLLGDDVARFLEPWNYGRLNAVERVLLAQRAAAEPVRTVRHFSDILRLMPPNIDRDLYLFNVGVDANGLDNDESVTSRIRDQQKKLEDVNKMSKDRPEDSKEAPAPRKPTESAPPPPPGVGGPGRPTAPDSKAEGDKEEAGRAGPDGRLGGRSGSTKTGKSDDAPVEYFDARPEQRKAIRQLYRKLDPTQEWAENNYYKLLIEKQVAELVPVNRFWQDYVKHDGKSPFLSRHLGEASGSFTEMMFALAVLDLPFEAGKHEVKFAGGGMTLTPASHLIAFHEEVRPANGKGGQIQVLVSQNFYRNGDRFRDENGEKIDKFITAEFLVHTVYGCQVVVTNPTSSRQKLTVLVQLPVGAIPVANGQFTRSIPLDLEPYRTQTIDYFFYFPKAGKFPHFPVQVARNEQFVVAAEPFTFSVVEKPTRIDTASWDYVSQNGTNDEVVAFLSRENVRALNLDRIAFRMKDREFFEVVTRLLAGRHLFQPTLWSYALLHADEPAARQYLLHADQIVNECGGPLTSPLLTIDPVARHQYEHLEYRPLVNARAHALGQRRQIVNERFLEQYHRFLKTLSYHSQLDDTDLLAGTYYLLLQDRIDEAREAFGRVNSDKVATRMQYDYCAAYLALFDEAPQKARAIAVRYANHPVDRWRNTFAAIVSQVDEIEGKGPKVADVTDRAQQQGALAATEPGFEFALDSKAIQLTWQNLEAVQVNYYLMDVELLFSRSPFVQQSGSQFASIRPNLTREVKLAAAQGKTSIPLPEELVKRNVLVEVTAAGKTRSAPYYANAMDVKFTENYGQVRVADVASGKPLPKVYVKVYARLADGSVKFHKDGYTDLRGRLDYVSVNTPERLAVERFAVLVLSEDRGALIRDIAPPQR
jgi:hypothetical protein